MLKTFLAAVSLLFLLSSSFAWAQKGKVDQKESHIRYWAIDTVTVDEHGVRRPTHATGRLGWVAVYHPSNQICFVEYVSLNPSEFDLLKQHAAQDNRIKLYEKGKTKREDMDGLIKVSGFGKIDLDKFYVRVP